MITEHPMLFSPEMREAIQDGRKTQTRRIVKKPPPTDWELHSVGRSGIAGWVSVDYEEVGSDSRFHRVDYMASVGDWLYVKETHFLYGRWIKNGITKYSSGKQRQRWKFKRVNCHRPCFYLDTLPESITVRKNNYRKLGYYKRPSIFMSRKDSRINLEITDIRVGQIRDISEDDARSEGTMLLFDSKTKRQLINISSDFSPVKYTTDTIKANSFKAHFAGLWDSINGKPRANGLDISWNANPWVWVLTFKVVR